MCSCKYSCGVVVVECVLGRKDLAGFAKSCRDLGF